MANHNLEKIDDFATKESESLQEFQDVDGKMCFL